ncbi:MAG: hypothetical protein PWQ10_192 [Patescibacteria group bacterium]|nr:hypothetical protein [Patescibacteria group bacterium]
MKKINIRRIYYLFCHRYLTLNNAVIFIAFCIAAGWVWGSMGVMQRNYTLQKELDDKSRQLIIAELDTENAKLQQRYYKTNEYKELAVRENLGLASPGESVLILPENSKVAKEVDNDAIIITPIQVVETSNFGQWMNFFFGGNSKSISK